MGFDLVQFLIERPLLILAIALVTVKSFEMHGRYVKRRQMSCQDDKNLMQSYVDAVRSGKLK